MRGGGKFAEVILLNAEIGDQLEMSKSTFDGEVTLIGAKVGTIVDMRGAKFTRKLRMDRLRVGSSLFMHEKAQFAEVALRDAQIGGQLMMNGSSFSGTVNLHSAHIGEQLEMSSSTFTGDVNLFGAKIDGLVDMRGAKFVRELNMDKLRVGSSLFMRDKAQFAVVRLQQASVAGSLDMVESTFYEDVLIKGSHVAGQLLMERAIFTKNLDMDSVLVDDDIHMSSGARFNRVWLRGAQVGDQLNLTGSTFSDELDMYGARVRSDFVMLDVMWNSKTRSPQPINLTFMEIGGRFSLSGSQLPSLDLSGSRIRSGFWLGLESRHTTWQKGAKLVLHNTEVGALQHLPMAWPDEVELEGFTYTFFADSVGNIPTTKVSGFEKWLEKQKKYSPQPYEQLANALVRAGHKDKAKEILYAGKLREHSETKGFWRSLWLWLLWMFIGYGYDNFRTVYWILALWPIGMLWLRLTREDRANDLKYWGCAYSIDMLLPIIELRKKHNEIDLNGSARVYFYFHRVMGYVLVFFLIAGLSGLTK